ALEATEAAAQAQETVQAAIAAMADHAIEARDLHAIPNQDPKNTNPPLWHGALSMPKPLLPSSYNLI
ncbi:MAG: hypothetical protein PHI89_08940, partial [Thiovulaceae bacterium]|nr:hypothetical protein [Sulfurimonadaceae bacterium]